MKPIGFHPHARSELLESARYYEAQRRGLARRFLTAVREATNRIQSFPLLGRVLEDDVRQCRVSRFPYGLIYRVKEDGLEVIAVMHLHRRPGYWKSRMAPG
jgi:plasmid stabilization system protein ParE